MSDAPPARPTRQQFAARVRFNVAGESAMSERFAANLSQGGMFVRDDRPPAVGSTVLLEFLLPDGKTLCRVSARVVHARPAQLPGEATAGMGLQFLQYDAFAQGLLAKQAPAAPEMIEPALVESLAPQALSGAGPVVGIDLGTTNSCVAIADKGPPRVLQSQRGYETVPSIVFFPTQGSVLIGHQAAERMILEPHRAIYGSKRFIGRPFASREVRTFGHFFHYALAADARGQTAAQIDDKVVPLVEIAQHILGYMRQLASEALGADVQRAVVTVPAYFGEHQRQAVREAGQRAGLTVERVLSEPTAAAVAFGFGRGLTRTVLVYDLGGGTFDASILRIDHDTMEVLATDGDAFLGGSDFDDRLTEFLLTMVERQHDISLRKDAVAVQRVRFAAELAKRQLSEAREAPVDVPFLAPGVNLKETIAFDLFESLTEDLVTRTLVIVEQVLKLAGLKATEIDDVVLVGGQSRSPQIARRLSERFGKPPSHGVHPDHAVALGAAIVASAAYGTQPVAGAAPSLALTDLLPASIRIGLPDGTTQVLLPRGTKLPAQMEFEIASTPGKTKEYVAALYRGEQTVSKELELLGQVRVPSSFALEIAKSKATLTLSVSSDGILSLAILQAVTGARQTLEVSLVEDGEVLEVGAAMELL